MDNNTWRRIQTGRMLSGKPRYMSQAQWEGEAIGSILGGLISLAISGAESFQSWNEQRKAVQPVSCVIDTRAVCGGFKVNGEEEVTLYISDVQ